VRFTGRPRLPRLAGSGASFVGHLPETHFGCAPNQCSYAFAYCPLPPASARRRVDLATQHVTAIGHAITFHPPVWAIFEREQFWEAHRVMFEEPYWRLENLCDLDQIGRSHGFKLAMFPVKWVNTAAAPRQGGGPGGRGVGRQTALPSSGRPRLRGGPS
jgi:hypothetical protein